MPMKNLEDYMQPYEDCYPHLFNRKLNTFSYIEKIVLRKRKENIFQFQCLTHEKKKIYVCLELCTPELFRLRMSKVNKFFSYNTAMVAKTEWKKVHYHLKENKENIAIETQSMIINVQKNPWQVTVNNKNGKIIFQEQIKDISGLQQFLSYPPGYGVNSEKETSFYESFVLRPDEQLYGLGEKYDELNKRGKQYVSWNVDTATTVTGRAYKNIPLLFSTYGYGLFINSTAKIIYQLGSESYISASFRVEDEQLDYYFIYGPSFKEILNRYTELTGKPPVPPKWSFGLWMSRCSYMSRKQLEDIGATLRKKKIPCDVLHIDPWWMKDKNFCDFEWDINKFPKPEEMLKELKKKGFKVSLWEQPYVPKNTQMYQEGKKRGYFMKTKDGKVYSFHDFQKSGLGVVDFTNPEAVKWYQTKHKELLEMGVSAFKTDMSEGVPEDGYFHNGQSGKLVHNLYSLLYNKKVYEISASHSKEYALVWGRAGTAGSQRYPIQWSGDSNSTFPDLACNLRSGLSAGLSGLAFWSCDIGGFIGKPSPELYIRWAQFGLFISHARCHGSAPREPWEFGKKAENIFRFYANLRYQLLPYIYTHAHIAHRTGLPVIRPLVLEYQNDPNVYHQDLEYLLGDSILVAPILDETNQRDIYLPEGEWIDFVSKKRLQGNQHISYKAPLSRLPLFIKQDSIIPLGPLMNYVDEKEWNPISLEIFLKSHAQFTLIDDRQEIKFSGDNNTNGITFKISPSNLNYYLHFHKTFTPKKVVCNGKPISLRNQKEQWENSDTGWRTNQDTIEIKLFGLSKKVIRVTLIF